MLASDVAATAKICKLTTYCVAQQRNMDQLVFRPGCYVDTLAGPSGASHLACDLHDHEIEVCGYDEKT